jgi:hypothetical protein
MEANPPPSPRNGAFGAGLIDSAGPVDSNEINGYLVFADFRDF